MKTINPISIRKLETFKPKLPKILIPYHRKRIERGDLVAEWKCPKCGEVMFKDYRKEEKEAIVWCCNLGTSCLGEKYLLKLS